MKTILVDLPYHDTIDLQAIADLHIGDPLVDRKAVQARLDYVLKHDNCYAVLNGDLIDNATKNSIGDIYSQISPPQQALQRVIEMLKPLADAGKITAITPGNHEARTYKTDGIDPTWVLAQRLGLEDKLTPTSACLLVTIGGKQRYTVYVSHGSGGGRKVSGKMLKLDALADVVDADVYVMSHVHQPGAYRRSYYRVQGRKITKVDKLFVLTAATLDYGSYADTAGMQPASTVNPIITLSGTTKFACALV